MTTRLETPPDQDQRDLVLYGLDRSMLVEAAAGTGKTASMVGRMVELLKRGACPGVGSIAAVTFTRKAAAELRSRFQLALEKAARDADGDERRRLDSALANIERCFIGTIHSFCARLLRERPVEAGVDLAFQEMDEDDDELLRRHAWREYCAKLIAVDPRGTLAELTRLDIDPVDLEKAFHRFAIYPDVDRWPVPEGGASPELAFETARRVEEYVEHIRGIVPRLPSEWGTDQLIPRLRSTPRVLAHYDDLHDPARLARLLERWFDKKPAFRVTRWTAGGGFTKEDARAEESRWNNFRSEVVAPYLASWREARYGVVLRALSEARDLYDSMRQQRGRLNFQDLLMKAASLLRGNPHVRRYFQERFTHLLVDEFQDTDPVQAEVMMLLTSTDPAETDWRRCRPRPGSLFVVGDPKQSIYRFRRADVQTYNEVKRLMLSGDGAGAGLLVRLSTNFRTVRPLVEWVNSVFEPGDDAGGDGAHLLRFPGRATDESPCYVALDCGRAEGSRGGLEGLFLLEIPREVGRSEKAISYEADLIARFIRSCMDRGETVSRTSGQLAAGRAEAVDPSDFLIIAHNKKHLSTYAKALQRYGVPGQVTGGTELNEVEELSLLRSCLAAVTRPDDPVALVGALRGESFGISDAALYRFKKAGGRFNYMVRELPGGLEQEDRLAFADSFERLRRFRGWLATLPAVTAFEKIVSDLGLMVLAATGEAGEFRAGSLAKALELVRAMQRGEWSVLRLVEYLGEIVQKEQAYDGISALSGEEPAVRIMNLHKAKGLEAPFVFLAGAYGESLHEVELHIDRSGGEVLGYMAIRKDTGGWHPPLLAHPGGWSELAEREDAFRAAEALRLRYVAATRSACAMCVTQRSVPADNRYNHWRHFTPLLQSSRPLEDPGSVEARTVSSEPVSPREAAAAAGAAAARFSRAAAPTYDVRQAKEMALSGMAGRRPPEPPCGPCRHEPSRPVPGVAEAGVTEAPPPEAGGSGIEFGTAVHRLLELAMTSPELDLESWAETSLAGDDLHPEWGKAAARAARAVTVSELWKRATASGRVLTEVPFQVVLEEKAGEPPVLVRGAVDLAFREPAGWVLVDYKTDSVASPEDARRLAAEYAPQVEMYARAWRLCTGEEVSETGFFFTGPGEYLTAGGRAG